MSDTAPCSRCGARIAASRVEGEFAGACPRCLLGEAARAVGSLPVGSRVRDYEIVELIGRGGMGSVYKARQLSLGRFVALKILLPRHSGSPDFITRFEREARLLAGLSHPNLVHVYDFGRDDDGLFLAMEHVEGRPLRLPTRDRAALVRIVRDVALALQKVHDAGMVHRDVKPSNILIAADGTPKLGDFGIVVEPQKDDRLTETGVFVGSPHYASPEHIEGRTLDGRSDLYALGVILFEGLAGRPPFTAPSSAAVLAKHIHEPPPLGELVGKTTPRLRKIVERLLAKRPEDRYERAADLAVELERVAAEAPAPSRRGILIGAGAAAVAAIAVGAGLKFRNPPAPSVPKPPLPPAPAAVDLLRSVHLDRDTVWGEWSLEGGAIRCAAGRRAYRVQFPYEVPEEYDLSVQVERLSGVESFHVGLSNGSHNWSLMLDTTINKAGATGLHLLDGRMGSENETTRIGRFLQQGLPTDIDVRVRRDQVVATLAGQPLIDWKGDIRRLSLMTSAFRVPSPRTIFVGAEMDSFAVRRMVLTPVSKPGRSLIATPPPLPADPKAPVDLLPLVALDRDAVWGQWTMDQGKLASPGGARAHRVQIPYELPEEYDLRVTFRRLGDSNSLHIGLSSAGNPFALLLEAGGPAKAISGIHLLDSRAGWENETTGTRPILPRGVPVTLEISVRKGRVTAAAGGTTFIDWKGPATRLGPDPNFRIANRRIPWFGTEVDALEISGAVLTPVTGAGRFLP